MERDISLTPQQFLWSINGRHDLQKLMLDLHMQYDEFSSRFNGTSDDDKKLQKLYRDLVSISFSLWRAVFLADREFGKKTEDADSYLKKILTDNSI